MLTRWGFFLHQTYQLRLLWELASHCFLESKTLLNIAWVGLYTICLSRCSTFSCSLEYFPWCGLSQDKQFPNFPNSLSPAHAICKQTRREEEEGEKPFLFILQLCNYKLSYHALINPFLSLSFLSFSWPFCGGFSRWQCKFPIAGKYLPKTDQKASAAP